MKKRYLKNILIAIGVLIIFMIPNKVSAITSAGEYVIEDYNIDMIVNEDNTFNITEKIKVNFTALRHRNI